MYIRKLLNVFFPPTYKIIAVIPARYIETKNLPLFMMSARTVDEVQWGKNKTSYNRTLEVDFGST